MTSRLPYIFACLALGLSMAATARAQSPDGPLEEGLDPELFGPHDDDDDDDDEVALVAAPLRILGSLGGGTSMRFVENLTFEQGRFAPAYLDAFGGVVLPSSASFRHGAGLGVSANLTGDGGIDVGVDPWRQLTLAPTYLGYVRIGDDFVLTVKAAALFAVTPALVPGGEVAGGLAFLLTAGFGIYAEVGASVWVGSPETPNGGRSIHPLASGELGLIIDYEVLP